MPVVDKRAESRTRYYTRDEAQRLGWDVGHPSSGGRFLEEQELVNYFPLLKSALGSERPDFAALGSDDKLRAVIECKGNSSDLDEAVQQAKDYAETINRIRGFDVRVAVGIAGTPDKVVRTRGIFRMDLDWVDLSSNGYPLTQMPTLSELQIAVENGNGTTDVQLPDEREFFDAAIRISHILRLAKIEEAIRPKIVGAIILALYRGEFSLDRDTVLEHINTNVKAAVNTFNDVPADRRDFLISTLRLSTESHALGSVISDVVFQLDRLNVRSIMRSGVDFLGSFYETFLRYGQDTKKLGIVFTPRHITRFCADLTGTGLGMTVYDPASGTGGFLVAAFDRMMKDATTETARSTVKNSLYGCDTNATVWALAVLNMFFRGDGKSHIVDSSCFSQTWNLKFDRVLMNPPFSQPGEPETQFIDHALANLKPGGVLAVVVKTTVMVDPDLSDWRTDLITKHHVMAVISLPQELFYPTAAPTVILVVKAHSPRKDFGTFLARVENDGYKISKKRRILTPGSVLPDVLELYSRYEDGNAVKVIPNFAMVVSRDFVANGQEICAERWLPSAKFNIESFESGRLALMRQLSLAVANFPDAVDELIEGYEDQLADGVTAGRPNGRAKLSDWFTITGGKSSGASNYQGGSTPYISSSDGYNGIVDLVFPPEFEIYDSPTVTVSAFGQAYIQPWKFCARGNGGSAVRILIPNYGMTLTELIWIVAQINAQRWRFHYGRMATVGRLSQLAIDAPLVELPEIKGLESRVRSFRRGLSVLSGRDENASLEEQFKNLSQRWKSERGPISSISRMAIHPAYQQIIGLGEAVVPLILNELEENPDHWFWALHAITGDNPVKHQEEGNVRAMAQSWVSWGKQQGYIA